MCQVVWGSGEICRGGDQGGDGGFCDANMQNICAILIQEDVLRPSESCLSERTW